MKIMWVGMAVLGAIFAMAFECVMARRDRRVRCILEQPLQGIEKERGRLYRILFVTSLLCMLYGCIVVASHRRWVTPVQGVAVVIDAAASVSDKDPSVLLSIQKAAAKELIQSLPGVTFSLYELQGGKVSLVVPPTIDRIFFELQLDGILPVPQSANVPTLFSVQKDVLGQFQGVPPWVVVFSPVKLMAGKDSLDGVASVVVERQALFCSLMEMGLSFKESTIEKMVVKMIERFNLSTVPVAPDTTESYLMVLITGLALVCFVQWRRVVTPLCALGIALIATPQLFALSETEANSVMRQAIDIADASDFTASQKMIESLLTTVASPKSRQRILYDRAVLSYLQGKDEDVLLWLHMDPSIFDGDLQKQAADIQGLALIRLVSASSGADQEGQRKKDLQEWMKANPEAGGDVMALATSTLFSPSIFLNDYEGVVRTLEWLDIGLQDAVDGETKQAITSANLLTKNMNSEVEKRLREKWPAQIADRFSHDIEAQKNWAISLVRIWYDFAAVQQVDRAVSFLLEQASMSANGKVFFPSSATLANSDLALVSALLTDATEALPVQQQPLMKQLLSSTTGSGVHRSAIWYARSVVWPSLCLYDQKNVQPIAQLLCHEVDASTGPIAKQALASIVASACSIPGSSEEISLENVLSAILVRWYEQDPEEALDAVIGRAKTLPSPWSSRLLALITPYIQQAKDQEQALPSAIAKGVGDEASTMDPVLVGRLWQIAKSMTDSRHNVFRYVEHLTALFSEMRSSLSSPDDPILRSFVLIFSVQPDIFDQLSKAPLFQQDPAQRSAYDQLLNEWNQECLQIRQRIAEPSTFRLPKVIDELMRGQDALRRLLSLLRERESSVPEAAPQEQSAGPSAPLSIRGEDAIRLFQEMDRSDRELFQS